MAGLTTPTSVEPPMNPVPPMEFQHVGFGDRRVEYERAWAMQRDLHDRVAAGTASDTVLLLEHPPVYTAGKRTTSYERPAEGIPVIDVDRGGRITWHGPGQLVGYPIVRLAEPVDVVAYVRRLEGALIDVCAEYGLTTVRIEGRAGVWLPADDLDQARKPARKIAAIGVRVSRGVTMHGFSLNCDPDLSWFTRIVPCGLEDAGVTSLSQELGHDVTVAEVLPFVERHLAAADLPGHTARTTTARTTTTANPPGREGDGPTKAPDGRRLLRVEARNARVPIERKPPWIRTRTRRGPAYDELAGLVKREGLHTVCQEAGCPNIFECWEDREATFLIGGDECTRRCDFCQIHTGRPAPLDRNEPRRVAESVRAMGLRYATVTGVARDDLDDEGAWLYSETIREIHRLAPGTGVEILVPDFSGRPDLLQQVFDAAPQVFAHNLETVPRVLSRIRPAFTYDRSLDVLAQGRRAGMVTKSNLILGLGETREEISQTLVDLHAAGCDLVTITQYLRPSALHHPVERWVPPEEFVELREEAEALGFAGVMSGPLVRSSYRAGRLWAQAMRRRGQG